MGRYGVMAEFADADALLAAARAAYEAGYRKLDAYSPFPVHGLADAIGFRGVRVVSPMVMRWRHSSPITAAIRTSDSCT